MARHASALMAALALALLIAAGVVAFTWAGYAADIRCYPLLYPSQNHDGSLCRDQDLRNAAVAGSLVIAAIVAAIGAGVVRARARRMGTQSSVSHR